MEDLLTTDACTMPTADRPLRVAEFDALFEESLRTVDRGPDFALMRLSGRPGLRDRVVDLTERESACCSFFTFAVSGTDDDLLLDIRVPSARADILDSLVDRALARPR